MKHALAAAYAALVASSAWLVVSIAMAWPWRIGLAAVVAIGLCTVFAARLREDVLVAKMRGQEQAPVFFDPRETKH